MNTLVVEVRHDPDGTTTFHQPSDRHRDEYLVRGDQIFIFRNLCPVHLQFVANVPLTAVGFAEVDNPIPQHSTAGPCGGCFSLETEFKLGGGTLATPLILDHGDLDKPLGGRYHFKLWTFGDNGSDVVLTVGIDPQIYNQGDGPDPDGDRRSRARDQDRRGERRPMAETAFEALNPLEASQMQAARALAAERHPKAPRATTLAPSLPSQPLLGGKLSADQNADAVP